MAFIHCAARELSLAPRFTNPQRAGKTLRRSYSEIKCGRYVVPGTMEAQISLVDPEKVCEFARCLPG